MNATGRVGITVSIVSSGGGGGGRQSSPKKAQGILWRSKTMRQVEGRLLSLITPGDQVRLALRARHGEQSKVVAALAQSADCILRAVPNSNHPKGFWRTDRCIGGKELESANASAYTQFMIYDQFGRILAAMHPDDRKVLTCWSWRSRRWHGFEYGYNPRSGSAGL